MKKTIEIDDTLQERVDAAKDELWKVFSTWKEEGLTAKEIEEEQDYYEAINDAADANTPVYYSEIDDIFYLHGVEVEQAFDDAGIGDKNDKDWPAGWRAAAICCYIQEKLHEEVRAWFDSEKEKEAKA